MTIRPARAITAAVAVGALVLLAGCGVSDPDRFVSAGDPAAVSQSAGSSESGAAADTSEPGGAQADGAAEAERAAQRIPPAGAAEAGTIAAEAHDGSNVIEIELDRAHGTTVWQVTVVSADGRFDVDVDIATGAILGARPKDSGDLETDLDRLRGATLDHVAALDVVLARHDGARLAELDLDDADGRPVWEAEIVTVEHQKYEVVIDAVTGEVLTDAPDD